MEQHFLYFPDREIVLTPERYGLDYEDVTLTASDGVRLHGWYVSAAPARPVVLFFHGNAGNISHRVENLWYLHRLGLGVLIIDYRGYGKSAGEADEEGLRRDALAARSWLTAQGVAPQQTVYFGRSLGAAVALQLALEEPPAALVLESPFTSIRELGRRHYPLLYTVLGWMLSDRYENRDKISRYQGPLLVFQGERDTIVPVEMARQLFAAANEPKRLYLIPGAGHNDTYEAGGSAYWQIWQDFIARWVSAPQPSAAAPPPGA